MSSVSPTANDARVSFTIDSEPVVAIVTAVARLKGVDALALSPLYEVVDADAIQTLYRHKTGKSANWTIEFQYEETQVTITSAGEGSARPLPTKA